MRVEVVAREESRIDARLVGIGNDAGICFDAPDAANGAVADALLATSLLPAMRDGGALQLPGPLSPQLEQSTSAIQELLLTWDRLAWRAGLHPVSIEATACLPEPASGTGVGCFFSGGVDSFYTALKHQDEITHLVFIHGLDVALGATGLRGRVMSAVHAAAQAMGKDVIEVETDVRRASDPIVDWLHYHGSVLAAVGHLLTPHLRKVFLPASDTYATLSPFGSHPLLDPLWGSERLTVVHDGCEATRADKVVVLGAHDVALQWLRVCPKEPEDGYNCGRCHKCVRTMVVLRMEGLLDRCKTFDTDLDLKAFARLGPPSTQSRMLWDGYYRRLVTQGSDPALARAIRSMLARWREHVSIERVPLANKVRAVRSGFRGAGR